MICAPALALNPITPLSQYGHTAWHVRDGTFAGAPTSLAQTKDGYLWIGTRGGLYRFDGVHFQLFAPQVEEPVRSARIISLLSDREGSLWIGTGYDLERWREGVLTHFPEERGANAGYFIGIYQAHDGRIWANRAHIPDGTGPFCKVEEPQLVCYGTREGIRLRGATASILEDADGSLWTHSDVEIVHWDPVTRSPLPGGLALNGAVDSIQYMARDPEGSLLVGMVQATGGGLSVLKDGVLQPYRVGSLDGRKVDAQQLFLDSTHCLWIGTQGHGVYRVNGTRVEHYGVADGLSGDTVNAVFEDREGNVWIATSDGVDQFRNIRVASYSEREGLSGDLVSAVMAAHDGSIWMNNFHSLDVLRDGVITTFRAGQGLPGAAVTSLFEDRQGRMWVGVDDGLHVFENGHFKAVTKSGNPHLGGINAITQDHDGAIWAMSNDPAPHGSLLHIANDTVEEQISFETLPLARLPAIAADPADGIWLPMTNGDLAHWHGGHADIVRLNKPPHAAFLTGMVATADGTLYISGPSGLIGWRAGHLQRLTEENGLPCEHLYTLVLGKDALWMYGDCGLLSVSESELSRWWREPKAMLHFTQLGALDGAQPASAGYFPRSSQSPDGRIWLANSSIVQMVDPAGQVHNAAPPPVQIERLVADRKVYLPQSPIRLPPLIRDLEIDYTALSFSIPERVQFQYRLEGHDAGWVDAQTRRQAFYTDLAPGKYRFRVKACNNDGVWNDVGAVLDFEISPTFYQTKLFVVACVLGLAFTVWALYLIRVRQVANRMVLNLRAKSAERERIARELHDTLLQGMQGLIYKFSAIGERLPHGDVERGNIEGALDQAQAMLSDGRDRVAGLRHATDLSFSLGEALGAVAEDLASQTTSELSVNIQGEPKDLTFAVKEELYRIGVEALTNAFRHADATKIEIELGYDMVALTLRVRDNGRGFDVGSLEAGGRPGHFGLVGIRERAHQIGAELQIKTRDGAGTEVSCRIDARRAYRGAKHPSLHERIFKFWRHDDPAL
jgi:signal transduction histidine kinase/ligand-binding sensor domain-containing protein